ncbi:MAG: agmatinase [Defluviitaleaceae bacterium]|nr:agmatinase [Defluviitaleaceae bacterium]
MENARDIFMACDSDFDGADIVLFSAPFDGTTSFRPGARFAGGEIRRASYGIETYSPYQNRDLGDLKIFDAGELELPFGNATGVLEIIEAQTAEFLSPWTSNSHMLPNPNPNANPNVTDASFPPAKKTPVLIGGEHLISLGAIRAAAKKFPDLHILHFDAHADLRDDYLGEKNSHATVMRRAWEIVGDNKIFQLGIRSGDTDEFAFAAAHTVMHKFDLCEMEAVVDALQGKPVYFSLDLDVLDPSVLPGTGTPEPGGVSFSELHDAILLLKDLNIVAADIVELAPNYDTSGVSTVTACKIIREILMTLM